MDRRATEAIGIEQGLSAMRSVLAILTVVTIMTAGYSSTSGGLFELVLVVSGLSGATMATLVISHHLTERPPLATRSIVVLQLMDIILFTAYSGALETYVVDAAWALFVIPIVLASLRLNDLAVVGTWLVGAIGYALAGQLGWRGGATDAETLAGRFGVLLAVAAAIALLARWLQEEWRAQSELATEAELRLQRLTSIESAARAMRTADSGHILEICVGTIVSLGFDAAAATRNGTTVAVAGQDQFAPADPMDDAIESDEVHITRWRMPDERHLFSASTTEPFSKTVITGWRANRIDRATANLLHDLVATATTALEAAHYVEEIRHRATHDPLTNLANRAEFDSQLGRTAEHPGPIAVLYIDLDRFKLVNDTHGHHVGDKVLTVVARRLQRAIGDHGLVARLGGDEFAILLTGSAATHAGRLGIDLVGVLSQPFVVDGLQLTTSASIGSTSAQGPTDPTELVRKADRASYAAKSAGRDNMQQMA